MTTTMKKILAIFGFMALSVGAFAQQTKPAQKTTPSDTVNRNADRGVGNKKDNLLSVDTASGAGSKPPHNNTPEAVKSKAESNNTKVNPDPGNTYNRSSNGGVGTDFEQKKSTTATKPKSREKGKVKKDTIR